jgi:hypothetical protein
VHQNNLTFSALPFLSPPVVTLLAYLKQKTKVELIPSSEETVAQSDKKFPASCVIYRILTVLTTNHHFPLSNSRWFNHTHTHTHIPSRLNALRFLLISSSYDRLGYQVGNFHCIMKVKANVNTHAGIPNLGTRWS